MDEVKPAIAELERQLSVRRAEKVVGQRATFDVSKYKKLLDDPDKWIDLVYKDPQGLREIIRYWVAGVLVVDSEVRSVVMRDEVPA